MKELDKLFVDLLIDRLIDWLIDEYIGRKKKYGKAGRQILLE